MAQISSENIVRLKYHYSTPANETEARDRFIEADSKLREYIAAAIKKFQDEVKLDKDFTVTFRG